MAAFEVLCPSPHRDDEATVGDAVLEWLDGHDFEKPVTIVAPSVHAAGVGWFDSDDDRIAGREFALVVDGWPRGVRRSCTEAAYEAASWALAGGNMRVVARRDGDRRRLKARLWVCGDSALIGVGLTLEGLQAPASLSSVVAVEYDWDTEELFALADSLLAEGTDVTEEALQRWTVYRRTRSRVAAPAETIPLRRRPSR